jgi:hypothetical protein
MSTKENYLSNRTDNTTASSKNAKKSSKWIDKLFVFIMVMFILWVVGKGILYVYSFVVLKL